MLACMAVALWAPAAAAAADPPLDVPRGALEAALQCPLHFAHPSRNPVLLVHGTGINAEESWGWNYAKALPAAGWDTCTVTLPDRALGDIQVSSEYVVYAIERVQRLTGRRLTVITHSQGGMEGRWAVRWWLGARSAVDDLVDLASPNHGIYGADLCAGSGNCWPAVWQMASASKFLGALDRGDETPGAVSYTQIYSTTDELVEPSSTAPLRGGSNIAIQDVCPGRPVHHVGLLSDPLVWELVVDAMTHRGPARVSRVDPAACLQPLMPGVTPADAVTGNAFLYGRAALAFEQHDGVQSEPPLKPYAR